MKKSPTVYYGYYTKFGFRGLVDGHWMLFATEEEYKEYLDEESGS